MRNRNTPKFARRSRESREAREERMRADQAKADWVSLDGHVSLEEQARRDRAAWEAGLGLVSWTAAKAKPREKRIVSLRPEKYTKRTPEC
jgi:hypothetical protein